MGIHILSVNRKISVKALILYNQLPNSPIALDCAGASCPGGWDKGGEVRGLGNRLLSLIPTCTDLEFSLLSAVSAIFRDFFASINKTCIFSGGMDTRLSFYGV